MSVNGLKLCPLLKEPCIQDGCTLWVQVQAMAMGPLGIAQMTPVNMCGFIAHLMVAGSPKPPAPINIPLKSKLGL